MDPNKRLYLLWLLWAVCVGLVAVSGQSLWIDEANTAVKAVQPDWTSFISRMQSETGSDAQMPGYMAIIWAWEKVADSSEWGLRALNIPFLVMAIAPVLFLGPGEKRFRTLWILFALTSPFLWFYLDEARPYTLQFAASTFLLTGLCGEERHRLLRTVLFWIGLLLLCASSLTGVVFAFYFGLAHLWIVGAGWKNQDAGLNKKMLWVSGVSLGLLIPLGYYYFSTLLKGAAASSASKTSLESLIFSGYEYFGFLGWGPSRLQLRNDAVAALAQYKVSLGLYAVIWGAFGGLGVWSYLKQAPENWKEQRPVMLACFLGALTMLGVGVVGEFRLLGRHFMPLFPFVLCIFAGMASRLWIQKRAWVPCLLLLASFGSALSGRFAERHLKDAYREAAEIVKNSSSRGQEIWWGADAAAAEYYGVDDLVRILDASAWSDLEVHPLPGVVLLSKPDIYDADRILSDYLKKQGYDIIQVMPAFTVWKPGLKLER
ncbi:hypothetical protein P0Y35_08895 [Kiritimatiellaeota bacterium B1221]|nr:hypothetical protein [Kiritimatiellaeota bacterium B1221]